LAQLRDPALNKRIEQQAHLFAGAFLFPRESFRQEVVAPTLDYFAALKKRWGMSISAMIFRSYNLGMIDNFERADLYKKLTRRGWRGPLQEPFDGPTDMPLEKPRMLRRGLDVVIGEGYSRANIRSAICLPDKEVEQIIGLPEGYFNTADVVHLASPKPKASLRAVDIESGEIIEFPQRK